MRDVEVTIEPSGRGSEPGEYDLELRTISDGVINAHGWSKSQLTNDNLRKIADAIYRHLGEEVRLRDLTVKQVRAAVAAVKLELNHSADAAISGDRAEAYAAAERAEQAAHELKLLFGLEPDELAAVTERIDAQMGESG